MLSSMDLSLTLSSVTIAVAKIFIGYFHLTRLKKYQTVCNELLLVITPFGDVLCGQNIWSILTQE